MMTALINNIKKQNYILKRAVQIYIKRGEKTMNEKIGMITFEGKMYNLDEMKANEIKELMIKIKNRKEDIQKELEVQIGKYKNTKEVKEDER